VLKNVTVTLSQEAAHWARKRAAEENISVSRLIGRMIEARMKQDDDYQDAYRRWLEMEPMDIDARNRLSRDEAHARR
jgi:hypothetical protein